MKLKELDKHYKTETKLDQFTKAQNLITSAIFSGWKIDFEVNSNEDYDADNRDDHPSLISTYVWAPERWNEDHIEDLHLLTYTYPQAIIELAARLKDVMMLLRITIALIVQCLTVTVKSGVYPMNLYALSVQGLAALTSLIMQITRGQNILKKYQLRTVRFAERS